MSHRNGISCEGDMQSWQQLIVEIDQLEQQLATVTAERDEMRTRKDGAYLERNKVVAALAHCFPSGIAKTSIEGWSDDWHGCVYIDLPTGQVSWHYHDSHAELFADLPAYTKPWDGHTTEEKYRRVLVHKPKLLDQVDTLTARVKELEGYLQAASQRHANIFAEYYSHASRELLLEENQNLKQQLNSEKTSRQTIGEHCLTLTARVKVLETAMLYYKAASYQSHHGHFDPTGKSGGGCPQCIRARELREKAEQALTPPATAGEGGCQHEWGIDGMHSNEYCKKCFITKPPLTARVTEEG